MKKALVILFFVLVPGLAAAERSLVNSKAPSFLLSDQWDGSFSLQSFSGHPIVLIASDKEGSKQNRAWVERIQKKYGERVRIEGVADLRAAPSFLKSYVISDLKKTRTASCSTGTA